MSRIKRRSIKTKVPYQEKAKKKMSKQLIWTLILVGLMVASVFGIMLSGYSDPGEKEVYGEYEFVRTSQGWKLMMEDKQFIFQYLPSDLEELKIDPEITKKLQGSPVMYITFNPNSKNVELLETTRFGLSSFLADLQQYPQLGITEENAKYEQPIVDCGNATSMVPVMKLVDTNLTKVYMEGDCIIVEADKYDLPPMIDRLSFAILGIIK